MLLPMTSVSWETFSLLKWELQGSGQVSPLCPWWCSRARAVSPQCWLYSAVTTPTKLLLGTGPQSVSASPPQSSQLHPIFTISEGRMMGTFLTWYLTKCSVALLCVTHVTFLIWSESFRVWQTPGITFQGWLRFLHMMSRCLEEHHWGKGSSPRILCSSEASPELSLTLHM